MKQLALFVVVVLFIASMFTPSMAEESKGRFVLIDKTKEEVFHNLSEELSEKEVKLSEKEWEEWQSGLNEAGRFQVIGLLGGAGAFIIDTRQGHIWVYRFKPQSSEIGCELTYSGRVLPGKGIGEKILSVPSN